MPQALIEHAGIVDSRSVDPRKLHVGVKYYIALCIACHTTLTIVQLTFLS